MDAVAKKGGLTQRQGFATLVRMPELESSPRPQKKFRPFRMYSEQEARSMRRKKRAFAALVGAIVIAAVVAYAYSYYNSFFESTKEAQLATQSVPMRAMVNGKVVKIFVKETQLVKAGDPLVQIDPDEFQRTLDQRQRELDKSEDRLAGGKIHLDRLQKSLAESGDAGREKYEGARSWYVRLQGKTQELRASVAEAREQLKATLIISPGDGHIAQKAVEVGTVVSIGQQLVNVVGVGLPWVIANFKESQIEKMVVGQPADIFVKSLNKIFVGKVENISRAPNTLAAKTSLEQTIGRFIKSGAAVPVRIGFDAKGVERDINRLVNGASTEVKVYIK